MEDIKYFVTPSGNIVKGMINGDKAITNAEYYVPKKDAYTTPSQLANLAKERKQLSEGRVPLTEVARSKFSDYGIPLDAGAKKSKKKSTKPKSSEKKAPSRKGSMKSRKGSMKRAAKPVANISAGAPPSGSASEKKTSLADLFKQVSLHLANQTTDIIARGGDPIKSLNPDIKFFAK